MKHADETVERVLAGLREVEAPEGMERRVLEGARRAELPSAAAGWGSVWALAGGRRWAVAGAALLLVVLSWFAVRGGLRERRSEPVVVQSVPGVEAPQRVVGRAPVAGVEAPQRAVGVMAREPFAGGRARGREAVRLRRVAVAREVSAGDHPAPELPLTDEERLLLRIARRGRPEQVAALNPAVRAQEIAQDRAEFRVFFGPPAAGDDE